MSEEETKPKFDLNASQRAAVDHTVGPLLVVAGAGSGKTRVIVEKISHLVEKGMKPFQILAITFTNKAANEMRERIVVNNIDGVWVCTFHSLCVRILRKEANHLGLSEQFSIFDTDDQTSVIRAVLKEKELDPSEWKPNQILSRISQCKNSGITPDKVCEENDHYRDRIFAQVFQEYEKALMTNQAVDFDDLLIKVIELFQKHKNVLESYQDRFKYILVDEYQDTNTIQYNLISMLSVKTQGMMLTGDPDQSIYSWRGADINNILNFQKDFPGADIIKMEENYRSLKHILELSNQLIRHNTQRYPKDLKSHREFGEIPLLHTLASADEEADTVGQMIIQKRSEGYKLSDIAVFYRTNAQSRSLEEGLRRYDIPYIIIGGVRFFERMEIKDLIAYLRFIHNPSDSISLMRIVNKPSRGISETTKSKIRAYADDNGISCWESMITDSFLKSLTKRAAESVIKFNEMMADFFEHAFSSPDVLIEKVVTETDLIKSYTKKNGEVEEERIENIREFISYVKEFCDKTPGAMLSSLMEQIALVNDKKEGAEEGEDVVTLMTLHASKGLEFPLVFFVGLDENILPHKRSVDEGDDTAIEEERRLCYVGITRAQKEIHIFNVRERFTFKGPEVFNPSRFLSEMAGDHMAHSKRGTILKPKKQTSFQKYMESRGSDKGIRKGGTVKHKKYGKGIVLELQGRGASAKAKVYFNKAGEKDIMLEFDKMEVL